MCSVPCSAAKRYAGFGGEHVENAYTTACRDEYIQHVPIGCASDA